MGMNRNIGSFMGMNANNGRFMAFHPDQAGSCRIRRAYPDGTRRSGWIGMHWDALGCSLVHRDASQFTGADTGFGTGTGGGFGTSDTSRAHLVRSKRGVIVLGSVA